MFTVNQKSGYGKYSTQKRLGEIVYLDMPSDSNMVSRQGKTMEQYRDKVQMMGLIDGGIEVDEDGTRRLREKTWDLTGNIYLKKKKQKKRVMFDHVMSDSSNDSDVLASDEIVRLPQKPKRAFKRRKKSTQASAEAGSSSGESEELNQQEYQDDLNFLNKLRPRQIANLSCMFRNSGHGFAKDARLIREKNKSNPVVG